MTPSGLEMTDDEWKQSHAQTLGVLLSGEALDERGDRGEAIKDNNFLLLLNANHEAKPFTLPTIAQDAHWRAGGHDLERPYPSLHAR